MIKRALQSAQRQAVAKTYSTPAPVLGLNARDSLSAMDPKYALVLDNWFPSTNQLVGRAGSAAWATGLGTGPVESLMAYESGASARLLAFANHAVYNASASGAIGAALASGYTNNRWQGVNYKGFVLAVNGTADGCIKYDGAVVTANSITGVTGNMANIAVFQNRVFVLDTTLSFYFLATATISGAVSAFDLSTFARFGGFLMDQSSWSYLGSNNISDYCVFITSEGEIFAFTGTDPSSPTTWALNARFRVGKPIGRRCMVKFGAELLILTEDGIVALSQLMQTDREQPEQKLSDALGGLITQDVHNYAGNFGWEGVVCSRTTLGPMIVFNVPTAENSAAYQYVINTRTKAWCRFTGLNANTWCVFNNEIYFGGNDGKVYQADTGASDSGANIVFDGKTAFSYMDAPDELKQFTMARPIISSNGNIGPAVEALVDFEDRIPAAVPTFSGSSGSPWDTSPWDTSPWGGDAQINKNWISITGLGYAAALRVRVATNTLMVTWASNDWQYLPGGYL